VVLFIIVLLAVVLFIIVLLAVISGLSDSDFWGTGVAAVP